MAFRNYREESRKGWGTEDSQIGKEELTVGCLLRIADALESLNRSWSGLQQEKANLRLDNARLKRSNIQLEQNEEVLANAHLIAAAPELLEALKAMRSVAIRFRPRHSDWDEESKLALELCRSAIDKAEGASC